MAATSVEEQKKKESTWKLDQLRANEKQVRAFWDRHCFSEIDAPPADQSVKEPKFMTTFPFPYLNGQLHLGHTFTLSKCEFAARFHRLKGKRVLFPFAFHSTGMPIAACCDKLKQELKEGVPERLVALKAKQPQFIEVASSSHSRIEAALKAAKALKSSHPKTAPKVIEEIEAKLETCSTLLGKISAEKATGGLLERNAQTTENLADEAEELVGSLSETTSASSASSASASSSASSSSSSSSSASASSSSSSTPSSSGARGGRSKEAAKKVDAVYQWEILQMMGLSDAEIPDFLTPLHWIEHFPALAMDDLKDLGVFVDWRRTFTTTDLAPFYDSFIRWQFNILKAQGDKLSFGKRYTIWSPKDNQPCMDHDRASGEGVKPNEYTGIKLRLTGPFPEDSPLAPHHTEGLTMFLVAATMRPETMVGQTNCWVHPDGVYGIFRTGRPGEALILTDRAAYNLAFQGNDQTTPPLQFSPEFGKVDKIGSITGRQLIGLTVSAPCSPYEKVWVLPMMTVLMDVGTGIVTSVPSDAPADYAALRDLKRKPDFRALFGVQEEWLLDPIPIISIPQSKDFPAETTMCAPEKVEEMGINSQNDPRLEEAKEVCYKNGFGKGTMIVGPFAGQQVSAIKELARQEMISRDEAFPYAEPTAPVVSRSGDNCVVCLADQWYFRYGEENWREQAREAVRSMETFGEENRAGLEAALDKIQGWPVSRTYGTGSRIPWDQQYLIESLSDSTIYNAFYTVASKLHGANNMFGTKPSPSGLQPAQMTDAVWTYVFLDGPYPADEPSVPPQAILDELRNEFRYWFPTDMRASGRDLQGNHLIFYVYNNVCIFPKAQWPAGIRCNGFVLLDAEKMSKSKGNFLSLSEGMQKFGADALRWTLAQAGDQLTDANIETKFAVRTILRLHALLEWFSEVQSQLTTLRQGEPHFRDLIFESQIDRFLLETEEAYEQTLFRVVSTQLFDLLTARDNYRLSTSKIRMHQRTVVRFMEVFAIVLSPFCPYIAEHLWQIVNSRDPTQIASFDASASVLVQSWPKIVSAPETTKHFLRMETHVLEQRDECIRLYDVACKASEKAKKPPPTKCTIFVARSYPAWQNEAVEFLRAMTTRDGAIPDVKKFIAEAKTESFMANKKQHGEIMAFVKNVSEDYSKRGVEAFTVQLPFDEYDLLMQNIDFLYPPSSAKLGKVLESVLISIAEESTIPKAKTAKPGKPSFFFE